MKKRTKLFSLAMVLVMVCSLLPAVPTPAGAAETELSVYDGDYVVPDLTEDTLVAEIRHQSGESVKIREYRADDGNNDGKISRTELNEALTNAWQDAAKFGEDSSKWLPANDTYGKRVELHLYTDWIAVDGKFNVGSDDYFDGGELELHKVMGNLMLLMDLHGHTLDRGSTHSNQYGRILDLYTFIGYIAVYLVSTGDPAVITGGWDETGGAIRHQAAGCTLYMNNIIVENNHSERGAICMASSTTLQAENCVFRYNTATDCGGAISVDTTTQSAIALTDCILHDNSAENHGGAIYTENSELEENCLTSCLIYDNYAGQDGGGVYVESDAAIRFMGDTRIYDNYASSEGGGVFLESFGNFDGQLTLGGTVSVYSNTAGTGSEAENIHLDTGTTSQAELFVESGYDPALPTGLFHEENNQIVVKYKGEDTLTQDMVDQWFFCDRTDYRFVVDGQQARAQKLDPDSRVGSLSFFDATITAPSSAAGSKPGSVQIDNDSLTVDLLIPDVDGDELTLRVSAEATDGSTVKFSTSDTLVLEKVNGVYRGTFEIWNSEETSYLLWTVRAVPQSDHDASLIMTVTSDSVTENFYVSDGFAEGWVYAIGKVKSGTAATVTLYRDWIAGADSSFGTSFCADYVNTDGFNKGRLTVGEGVKALLTLDLNGCTIDRNLTEARESGQVFRLEDGGQLRIVDGSDQGLGTITGGCNDGNGGAFYMEGGELTVEGGSVTGNRCTGDGAGIYAGDDSTVTVTGGFISENVCDGDGAGIHACKDSTVTLSGGEISGNKAPNSKAGGGIFITGSASLTVDGGSVTGNEAGKGGGIYGANSGSPNLTVNGGSITGNTASQYGGGIFWLSDGKLFLNGGSVTGNTAGKNGGGVYADNNGSDPYVGGTVCIRDNQAAGLTDNLCLENGDSNLNHNTDNPLAEGALIGVNITSDLGDDNADCISADGSLFEWNSCRYFFADDNDMSVIWRQGELDSKNENQLVLIKKTDLPDSSLVDVTDLAFEGYEAEEGSITIDSDTCTIVVTVDPDMYIFFRSAALRSLTHTGRTVRPDIASPRDYTVPQLFVISPRDLASNYRWTLQVVPEGGQWNRYEVRVHGGSANGSFFYPGETVTLTADERDDSVFQGWEISGGLTDESRDEVYSFVMPAGDVVADALFADPLVYVSHFTFDDEPITDVAWNTALEDMDLPTVAIVTGTDGKEYSAEIVWNFQDCSYMQGGTGEQTFEVSGVIVLPDGIEGSDPEVTVTVTVNGMPAIPPVTPPADPDEPEQPGGGDGEGDGEDTPGHGSDKDDPERPDVGGDGGGEDAPGHNFSDLDPDAWYQEAVDYVVTNGMMQGYPDGRFDPNGTTTRAMIVTILWRLEGSPIVDGALSFADVDADQWYTEAVRWATARGIVEGYSEDRFGPNDAVTREQLATILYRYEQYKGGGFTGSWMFLLDYADRAEISDWAYEAMCWMTMKGVIGGRPGNILDPRGNATRAETAAMLQRYCQLPR